MLHPELMDGGCRGRVAGHNQGLDVVFLDQVLGDGQAALAHEKIAFFAIRRMPAVSPVDKVLGRHSFLQRLQDTQAANAAVKNTNGGFGHGWGMGGGFLPKQDHRRITFSQLSRQCL